MLLRAGAHALTALGFTLTFGVARILNLAHGAFFLLGAVLCHAIAPAGGGALDIALGGLVATVMVAGAAWVIFEVLLASSVHRADRMLILCLALSFFMAEAVRFATGGRSIRVPPIWPGGVALGETHLPGQLFVVLAVTIGLSVLLALVAGRSAVGRAVRAVAEDPDAARRLGIPVERVAKRTFVVGAALAALAGCLVAPSTTIAWDSWVSPLTKSFAIVVAGGAWLPWGTILAAGLLAGVETSVVALGAPAAGELASIVVVVVGLALFPRVLSVGGMRG